MLHFSIQLILLATVAAIDRHKIVYKSLQEATNECNQYNIQGGCLSRCVTQITRDWNDAVGMSPVYSRFFRPDQNDQCSNNRTQRCLERKVATFPSHQTCLRAHESVQCYMDQYGEVNSVDPQFIRFTNLQDAQLVYECAAMLGYSSLEQINALLRDSDFKLHETRCVFRCFMIRSGLYSDSEGLNMPRYYVLCGGYEDDFYKHVSECSARLLQEVPCDDKCTLAQRMATECIGIDYATSSVMQKQGDSSNYVVAAQGSKVYMINDQNANSDVSYAVVNSGGSTNVHNTDSSTNLQGSSMFFQSTSSRK